MNYLWLNILLDTPERYSPGTLGDHSSDVKSFHFDYWAQLLDRKLQIITSAHHHITTSSHQHEYFFTEKVKICSYVDNLFIFEN
jgi:hypothetical protein